MYAYYGLITVTALAVKYSNVTDKTKMFLCCRDYTEKVATSFAHHIQSEYCGVNISVSIEGIVLKHFSEST